ncbi:MAG: ABC transporter ATP-binding protein [Oscillatoria sp. PMC 1068.18]|nr:ABC transporter ATP-binding protein [Oscillatoria sp. PMC 1076.18]MEC4991264.1 ABC transporter ATP-binding protein [Oscillatoria sp. PMC 1068.18]
MAKVCLEQVTRKFENVTAIEEITFEVPDGEFWVLVGPSGCGKSTVMRTIAGLESVSSGKIYLDEVLVNEIPARQRDVAMVFQNYALYPHMTVAENLAFGLQMRKVDKETIAKRIEMVARSLDIAHLLNRKPKQLSGGQQQRVALGRAIARQPKVFLLDEPLSNLDAQLRDDTRAELKRLHAQVGITTIYVTHDQTEAMTLGSRLVVLERGRIQQIGRPQDVYAYPANLMVATFLGSPPMNILPVSCLNKNFVLGDNILPIPDSISQKIQPSQGEGFNLGIRPEDILARSSESGENLGKLSVEVELVEPLGRETLIRGKLPNSEVTLNFIAPASWQESPGSQVAIQLDLEKLFVFDPTSGKTVYPLR